MTAAQTAPSNRAALILEVIRYGIAGVINTAIGFSVTAGLDVGLGWNPHLANAAGYAVGVISSYILNRVFVFKPKGGHVSSAARYVVSVAIAFGLNQGVLYVAGQTLGAEPMARLAAQGIASVSYTICLFLLSKLWVFRTAPQAAA